MKEIISVIIPVYNVSNYLERCINSVLNQTYHDLEIIMVDDGSTDGSEMLCDKYKNQDDRIKVIHKENGGLADARNVGLKMATGDYIAFLDSDDWIDLDYYEVLYNKLVKNNSDIAIVGFLWVENNKFIKPNFYLNDQVFTSSQAIRELAKDELLTSHAWNKLFKRKVLNEIEFPKGRTYEDIFVMHKIFKKANKICVISDFKNYYFMHDKSIIHTLSPKNRLDEFFAFKSRYEDLKDNYPDLKNKMAEKVCERVINIFYINPFSKEEKKKYEEEIKEINLFMKDKNIMYPLGPKRKLMCIAPRIFGVAFKLKKKTPERIKEGIKILVKKNTFNKLDNGENRIILCGSPEYGNIGDLAIAYFTKRFMESNSNKKFVEITEKEFYENINYISKQIKPNDILLLQGGGNMGSEYIDQEKIRSKVIKSFPNNKIVIMPQTIYYTKSDYSEKIKLQMKSNYSDHKLLNIFSRESISFNKMKEIFKNDIYLVPDIVMSSTIEFSDKKRTGAMLCLRSDVEGILNVNDLMKIKECVRDEFSEYYITDTVYNTNIALKDRKQVLKEFWLKMQKVELVITDRLHGMIFAAITGTPCIVIGNYNHKVKTCYNWFQDLEYVEFCDTVDEIEKLIDKIDYSKTYKYPVKEVIKKFESLKNLIGK